MFKSTGVVEYFGETPAFNICSLKNRNLRAISPHLFIFTETNINSPNKFKNITSILLLIKQQFDSNKEKKIQRLWRTTNILVREESQNQREKENIHTHI